MAHTFLNDVFATYSAAAYEVMQSYMDTDLVTKTAFFENGLMVTNPIIAELAQTGTDFVDLPFWRQSTPRSIRTTAMTNTRTSLDDGRSR